MENFEEKNLEFWKIHDPEYIHYFYKITNNLNSKFYYGIHSEPKSSGKQPLNDGYWGSGSDIKRAIKVDGKENFTKECIKIFSTREELRAYEKEIVTEELIKDPMCYNKAVGGGINVCGAEYILARPKGTKKFYYMSRTVFNKETCETPFENTVVVKKIGEKNYRIISTEEYNENKKLYKTSASDTRTVEILENNIPTGKYIRVTKEEFEQNKDRYGPVRSTLGKTIVKNKDNPDDIRCLDLNDPLVVSKQFIGITKGIKQSKETILKKTGKLNGSYNTTWITDGIHSKKIKNGNEIPMGWKKGRNISKTKTKLLNRVSNVVEEFILPLSFFKDKKNKILISPQDIINAFIKNDYNWKKVSDTNFLGIKESTLSHLRKFYESIGYETSITKPVLKISKPKNKKNINETEKEAIRNYYCQGHGLTECKKTFNHSLKTIKNILNVDSSWKNIGFINDSGEYTHLLVNEEIKMRILSNGWKLKSSSVSDPLKSL